jgi:hypothetical protein
MFLLTSSQKAQIVKRLGETTVLAETEFEWELERPYQISLVVSGTEVAGWIDGKKVLQVSEVAGSLAEGGFGFACQEGLITSDEITIKPVAISDPNRHGPVRAA